MAVNQAVQWSTKTKLPCGVVGCCACASTLSANIIICVASSLTESGLGFIEGVLTKEIVVKLNCDIVYKYTLEYDDAQLADPLVPLVASQISGVFCLDCRATWTEELISQYALLEVQDTTTVNLTLTETVVDGVNVDTLSADVIISPTEGNCLESTPQGLFSACGEEFNSKYFPLSTKTDAISCVSGSTVLTELLSYTIPGNTLFNAGDRLEFEASGYAGLNTDTLEIQAVFGASLSQLIIRGVLPAFPADIFLWRMAGTITYTGVICRSTCEIEVYDSSVYPAVGAMLTAFAGQLNITDDVTLPIDFKINAKLEDLVGTVCLTDFNINKILAPV